MCDIVEQKIWHSVVIWKEYMSWFNYELINHFMIREILETFASRGFSISGTELNGFTSTWYRSSTFSVFNNVTTFDDRISLPNMPLSILLAWPTFFEKTSSKINEFSSPLSCVMNFKKYAPREKGLVDGIVICWLPKLNTKTACSFKVNSALGLVLNPTCWPPILSVASSFFFFWCTSSLILIPQTSSSSTTALNSCSDWLRGFVDNVILFWMNSYWKVWQDDPFPSGYRWYESKGSGSHVINVSDRSGMK